MDDCELGHDQNRLVEGIDRLFVAIEVLVAEAERVEDSGCVGRKRPGALEQRKGFRRLPGCLQPPRGEAEHERMFNPVTQRGRRQLAGARDIAARQCGVHRAQAFARCLGKGRRGRGVSQVRCACNGSMQPRLADEGIKEKGRRIDDPPAP